MDLQIAIFINKLGSKTFIDFLTALISNYLFLFIFGAIIIFLFLILDKKHRKIFILAILIAISLHFLITELFFKHFLGFFFDLRIRPYLAHPTDIISLGKQSIDASFPSAHMSLTAATLTIFTYFYKKIWPVAALFLLAMAFARIHNGMHYLTDVLAGGIFGIILGTIGFYTAKKL